MELLKKSTWPWQQKRQETMASLLTLLQALLLCAVQEAESAISVRKFVYQKDMSEHCRRRVMPSVFLGSHVMEAHSQILHFSQLEVPYSCFISIRTESGSNIILVIQLAADEDLDNSCSENNNQLLVYEMGETFGGYWGPLPDSVLQKYSVPAKYYTLKTTSTTAIYADTEESELEEETTTTTSTRMSSKTTPKKDYVEVEIPLVNVSGDLVETDSDIRPEKSFDMDETFDFIFDVTPKPDVTYESSIMPVVQFSMKVPYGGRNSDSGADDAQQQYQLDYNLGDFTQDIRLRFPHLLDSISSKGKKKYKYNANRRLNFNKNKGRLFSAKDVPFYMRKQTFANNSIDTGELTSTAKLTSSSVSISNGDIEQISESWRDLEDLMNKIKKNKSLQLDGDEEYEKQDRNVPKLSFFDADHSSSIFKNEFFSNNNTINTTLDVSTRRNNNFTLRSSSISENNSPESTQNTQRKLKTGTFSALPKIFTSTTTPSMKTLFLTSPRTSATTSTEAEIKSKVRLLDAMLELTTIPAVGKVAPEKYSTVVKKPNLSTVDRESWDNVVQAAPVIADILNLTTPSWNKYIDKEKNSSEVVYSGLRKKRYIQSISVKLAKPHGLTTQQNIITTSESIYRFSDIQDFAQLVELQDDEIYGRVALKYLGKYVGNMLFNICDSSGASKTRHVFLLNSSRIVISINRFTMKRMTLVATPARTLMTSDARCNHDQIECQVSGARVCIDSMTACDGVPNCGTYEIYDEDRLRCGAFKGLQHNVYVAAFTFLAVVLTMLYTIHYWLKRCVPKVSDAFFIYTDGSENILYLDSIMRSPTDLDDFDSKMVYHTHIYEEDMDSNEIVKTKEGSIACRFKSLLKACFFRKKHLKHEQKAEPMEFESLSQPAELKTMYSFTELELNKMALFTRDACIQTGESLEIEFSKEIKRKYVTNQKTNQNKQDSAVQMKDNSTFVNDDVLRMKSYDGELNMLKFLKDARTGSGQWTSSNKSDAREISKHDVAVGEERELRSTLFDSRHELPIKLSDLPVQSSVDVTLEKPGPSGYSRKRIRFDEILTKTITPSEAEIELNEKHRTSVFLGAGKPVNQETLDVIEEDQEHSTGRDFMRFWGGTKGKKSKKKNQLQLR